MGRQLDGSCVTGGKDAVGGCLASPFLSKEYVMRFVRGLGVVAVVGVLLAAGAWADEEKVEPDKLPKAVVDAIKAKYPGAKIVAAEKETEGDKTSYEVVIEDKDRSIQLVVTPQGKIVGVEQGIPAKDLPKAVVEAVEKKYPKGTILDAEEVTRDDKTTYAVFLETDVKIEKDKQSVLLRLTAEGKVTETQVRIAVKDLPRAVADAVEKKYPKATVTRANEATKEGKVTYIVSLETADKKVLAVLDAEGKVLEDHGEDKD
jgi:hypothetical protein